MHATGRLMLLFAPLLVSSAACAHDGFGEPGTPAAVTRTIHVVTRDSMRLEFDALDIREGEVIRFVVHNAGKLRHEFGIGDEAEQKAHRAMMRDMPDMTEDAPNVISLAPGARKSLIWNFSHLRTRHIVFACNVPGHAEAGMQQRIVVGRGKTSAPAREGID